MRSVVSGARGFRLLGLGGAAVAAMVVGWEPTLYGAQGRLNVACGTVGSELGGRGVPSWRFRARTRGIGSPSPCSVGNPWVCTWSQLVTSG